ncbi:BnaA04g10570D [Brassica napus]|uniref:BnaA04g10570D protein n=1 Tax=Brassica napus TaxID=3708 RepID=A0A078HXY8_BRANA|nr:BnaA04g10570D [Brassica napus]
MSIPVASSSSSSPSSTGEDKATLSPLRLSQESEQETTLKKSQGALPRSNSRVSSLATCCGPRFVELLWQLSLHALREVHRRTFPADVASNPLPSSLTDVSFSHAATLLPVTKARIVLERRRFLKDAETAVQRQAMWSNLAHEMTAEFRGLCAEEAYLQQELEKLNDLRNKVKQEGEVWDDLVSSSSQNSHLVSKSTRLWDSIMARKGKHEVLASGPIEDLIAHREHRYRISGSALLAAMDQSSQVPRAELLSAHSDDSALPLADDKELNSFETNSQASDETLSRVDDRGGRINQTVDVAEIIRRWTHALQRIHKQSLQLAKANDGEGPDILRTANDGGTSGHVESLAATLTEHQQHLASFQVLINQLKEVSPAIQKSILECTEKVNNLPPTLPPATRSNGQAASLLQSQGSGRITEGVSNDVAELTSKMSNVQLEKVSASPTLKLPQLFSSTPTSSGKGGNRQKRHPMASEVNKMESLSEKNTTEQQPLSQTRADNLTTDTNSSFVQNLKKSVREAALLIPSSAGSSRDSQSDEGSEHYFVPLSGAGFTRFTSETKGLPHRGSRLLTSLSEPSFLESNVPHRLAPSKYSDIPDTFDDLDSFKDYDNGNGFLSVAGSNSVASDAQQSFYDVEDQVFSPPLLMDSSLLSDTYEDLLAPLSETEAALMEL